LLSTPRFKLRNTFGTDNMIINHSYSSTKPLCGELVGEWISVDGAGKLDMLKLV